MIGTVAEAKGPAQVVQEPAAQATDSKADAHAP